MGEQQAERFEYLVQEYPVVAQSMMKMDRSMNALGALGWKCLSIAAADKTIGLNKVVAVFMRQLPPVAAPEDPTAAWRPDPFGRHQYRWWDGFRWTHKVVNDNKPADDPPTEQPLAV